MKVNRKQIGWIAGLACAVLLIVLLLTMCSGNGGHQEEPVEPSQAATETTEATEATTEATEEITEATEETTEATEETTEPTEESTEPTTGGNTKPGGTSGYNPGIDNDDEDEGNTGPTTEKAPEAGSEKSPYVETILQLPDAFASVSIPAEGTVYQLIWGVQTGLLSIEDPDAYVVYGGETYEPDEYGVVQVPFAPVETEEEPGPEEQEEEGEAGSEGETESQLQPHLFQLGSKSKEARSFYLSFQAPLGSAENPKMLEAVDGVISMEAALEAGDEDGYYFSYLAETGCRMTLRVESATENVEYDIIATVGETVLKLSEAEDGVLTVDIPAWETVLIQVLALPGEDGTCPAADIRIQCQLENTSGTKENPIIISGEFPIVTDVLEPKTEAYYSVFGAGGMILTIEDPDAYVIAGEETWTAVDGVVTGEVVSTNPREPVLIAVGNSGEAGKSFTVNFAFKPGNMMNPDQLLLDAYNTAVIAAGSADGYWYTWTAEEEGILTITLPDGHWMYLVNNITQGVYGELQYSDAEEAVNIVELEVAAGDELNLMVCTYDPANPYEIPAGELPVYATFGTKAGTRENPIWLTDLETVVPAAPGQNVYCNLVMSGVTMTVTGEGAFTVTYDAVTHTAVDGVVTIAGLNASRFEPDPMILTNQGTEAGEYTITFTYPEGSSANPRLLELMGEYTVPVKGDGEGYFFTWIANGDGEFTVSMKSDDWVFSVNNLTDYIYGDIYSSTQDGESTCSVAVSTGDEIQINIGTASGQDKAVVVEFDFYDPTYGTEENPVWLTGLENTVAVRPGAAIYGNVTLSNVTMTVTGPDPFAMSFKGIDYVSENGVVTVHGVDGSRWAPLQLVLTNQGESRGEYTVSFAYPVGSSMNPQQITEMTQYTASVVGDSEGYFLSWTAEADGVFVLSMLGDDWTCVVNNLTAGAYGDIQSSTDALAAAQSLEVKAGDEIQINIGTASKQNKDVILEVDFYDPTVGTEENPLWLVDTENTITVRPGTPVHCNVVHENVSVVITGDVAVSFDGVGYPAVNGVVTITNVKASRFMPKALVLTNAGENKTACTVEIVSPAGTLMNPEKIGEMGSYTAHVIGDSQGYFYTWTAEEAGQFTVTMVSDDWIYMMQKQSGEEYSYGASNFSTAGDPASGSFDVLAGDIVQINIGTASGRDKDVAVEFQFQSASAVEQDVPGLTEFEGSYVPREFAVLPEEIREMGALELSRGYGLWASKGGIYHLDSKQGPLVLLDFTDDTYVNLAELVETEELWISVETEDGTVVEKQCNELLQGYIGCAWVVEISEEETRTLYPLTEDLELILKALGQKFGWFDPESDGFLFDADVEPEDEEAGEDTLWMFSCHYIWFVMEDEDPSIETEPEQTLPVPEELPEETEATEPVTEPETEPAEAVEPETEPAEAVEPETEPVMA